MANSRPTVTPAGPSPHPPRAVTATGSRGRMWPSGARHSCTSPTMQQQEGCLRTAGGLGMLLLGPTCAPPLPGAPPLPSVPSRGSLPSPPRDPALTQASCPCAAHILGGESEQSPCDLKEGLQGLAWCGGCSGAGVLQEAVMPQLSMEVEEKPEKEPSVAEARALSPRGPPLCAPPPAPPAACLSQGPYPCPPADQLL